MNIATEIRERAELAETCARSGDLNSAAEILTSLSFDIRQIARQADQLHAALADDDDVINPYGSGPVPIEPREG